MSATFTSFHSLCTVLSQSAISPFHDTKKTALFWRCKSLRYNNGSPLIKIYCLAPDSAICTFLLFFVLAVRFPFLRHFRKAFSKAFSERDALSGIVPVQEKKKEIVRRPNPRAPHRARSRSRSKFTHKKGFVSTTGMVWSIQVIRFALF